MQEIKNSPWGEVDQESKIQEGVYFVSTPSHGGFMVHKSVKLSEAARLRGQVFGEFLAFEEDCDAAIVAWELQIFNGRTTAEDIKRALVFWHEDYVRSIGESEWLTLYPKRS